MRNLLKSVAKKVLGKKSYVSLRSRLLFNDLESPFAMSRINDFDMDWNGYNESNDDIRAVYIVSPTQRSGTNFLSHVLNKHPQLMFPEKHKYPDEHCLYIYIQDIKNYCYKTVKSWGKWTGGEKGSLDRQAKKMMASIGNGILDYFSEGLEEGQKLLFKTPDAGHLEDYFHLFPNTRVVILVRDGRDTIESFRKSWGGNGSFIHMSKRWKQRVNQIEEFKKRAEASGYSNRYFMLKYEELNTNANEELRKVFDFLNLDADLYPWSELDEAPVLGSSSFRGGEGKVHWNPIAKDQNFKPTGKWKNWSSRRKKVFKKIAGAQLEKLGYEEDLNW